MSFRTCCTYCLFVGGMVFFITSFVLLIVWPYLYYRILSEQLVLSRTSTSYEMWHDVPIPMYLEIYMYNFTNTEEVAMDHTIKPRFEELGPYVFRERHIKVNETWFDDNSTISYFQNRTWYFEPEMSNGSLTDEIMNVNVVMASIARALRGTVTVWMTILSALFTSLEQNIYIKKQVHELLFDGYDDVILDLAKNMSIIEIPIPVNLSSLEIPYDKFGWFYPRNGSYIYDGEFNMFTGAHDVNKLGILYSWNRQNETNYYGEGCNHIGGSTGELWPFNTDVDDVNLFVSDVCRTISLKHEGERLIEGISGSVFVGDDKVFDNGWHYPETACYCPEDRTQCKPSGVHDVSSCRFNAPIFLSYPHFYLADQSYLDAIEGLPLPSKEQDEFRIILEKGIGLPLSVRANLQANMFVEHIPGFNIINNHIPEMLVPMLWFRQEAGVTEEYAGLARLIINIRWGANILFYCVLSASIVAIATAIALFMSRRWRQDPDRAVLVEETD